MYPICNFDFDVYHLDLAETAFLQELERFKVVSLDIEILCRIPVDAIFFHRTECFADRTVCLHDEYRMNDAGIRKKPSKNQAFFYQRHPPKLNNTDSTYNYV